MTTPIRWGEPGMCSACRYWHFDDGARGQCRRHAPVSATPADGRARGWPETYGYDGCGDWTPSESVEKREVPA